MERPLEHGGWKTPKHQDKRLVQNIGAEEPFDQHGKLMLPAAIVHPFQEGDGPIEVANFPLPLRHHRNYLNQPSPFLLSSEENMATPSVYTKSPMTPSVGDISRKTPKNIEYERFRSDSPSSNRQDFELQSLRYQVQEIQNKLNNGSGINFNYQQILSEKHSLEQTLGATEHELRELKTAFAKAKQTEKKFSLKQKEANAKHEILLGKYNKASEELRMIEGYMQTIPSHVEHMELQKQLSASSCEISHLKDKVDSMAKEIAKCREKEIELNHSLARLSQEKEDLLLKLKLSENILLDIENQRTLAEGKEDTKENLLWRMNQFEKEMDSAKKLLSYRKTKIESLKVDIVEKDKKHCEEIQKVLDCIKKQKEEFWIIQRELEDRKRNEQKMKSGFECLEEKHKKLGDQLKVSNMQIKDHQDMSSTIDILFERINCAVFMFKDLIEISSQISHGFSPDISTLLGFPESAENIRNQILTLEDLKSRVNEVNELIQQLENIRTTLQDKYAGQISVEGCPQM